MSYSTLPYFLDRSLSPILPLLKPGCPLFRSLPPEKAVLGVGVVTERAVAAGVMSAAAEAAEAAPPPTQSPTPSRAQTSPHQIPHRTGEEHHAETDGEAVEAAALVVARAAAIAAAPPPTLLTPPPR